MAVGAERMAVGVSAYTFMLSTNARFDVVSIVSCGLAATPSNVIVIVSNGCRASLAPWYRDGGKYPKDDDDVPIYTGRIISRSLS